MNFRELIDREAAYADKAKRPRSMAAMAERCGVSRQHLYNLFAGSKEAPPWTVAKIARGLSASIDTVAESLDQSRLECEV